MPEQPKKSKIKAPKVPKPPKFFRDITAHNEANGTLDVVPGATSPICEKCKLNTTCRKPFIEPVGSDDPLLTVVFEGISNKEDDAGLLAIPGSANGLIREYVEKYAKEVGLDIGRIRYIATTRCAPRAKVNLATRGNWCRAFAVRDLRAHPPTIIMPVGTTVLGLLSHKSSAQDWAGRTLRWRGWPDDWTTDARYDAENPFTGSRPALDEHRIVWAIQAPRLIYYTQNRQIIGRWQQTIKRGVELAHSGATLPTYDRPYFSILETVGEVIAALEDVPAGVYLTYDTETTGILPFAGNAAIVFMMFRYDHPERGKVAFGFPWKYAESPFTLEDIELMAPYVLEALYRVRLSGHQIAFDVIYTCAQVPGADVVKMTDALESDTRHLIYAIKQEKKSLGLELVAYDWCPDMAGYEEEFVLLKDRYPELLDPGKSKDAHYARVPRDMWDTTLKPYVMGDVEVAYETRVRAREKLANTKRYKIPLANPDKLGTFRLFSPPSREFMYDHMMLPALKVLTRVMHRGLHVDREELAEQEGDFPKLIADAREKLRTVDPRIIAWCDHQSATVEDWEFDLEDRTQLKTILFDILRLPVKRITKSGQHILKTDDPSKIPHDVLMQYAAVDKYTLSALTAECPTLAPLLKYRKHYKSYKNFVRPMRNIDTPGLDKKPRKKDAYLMPDNCVHANFNQAATRAGRLGCSNPNLQQQESRSIIKRMYTSRFGTRGALYGSDLSQIELRLLAAACGDPTMVQAYRDNVDIHSLTTSRVFNVPYEHLEKSYMAWLQKNGRDKEAKELDSKRKVGKCVDPNSIILVNGKLVRISELHPGRQPDTFYDLPGAPTVRTPTGTTRINQFYSNGVSDRVMVCSRHGIVVCSKVHRFLMADGSLVMAKDLIKKEHTLAPVTPLEVAVPEEPAIPIDMFGKGPPHGTCRVKIHVDSNFAYLLGLFYGDGASCASNGNDGVRVVITTGGTPEYFTWQDQIAEVVANAGFEPKIERTVWDQRVDGPKFMADGTPALMQGSCGEVKFGSTRVSDLFIQLGAINDNNNRTRTLKIPGWLLNAPYETKMSFMAGLVDTDGSLRGAGLSITTKSWVFAQDIMVLLRGMRITHSLEPTWNTTYERFYFRINISKRDSWRHFRGRLKLKHKAEGLCAPAYQGNERPNTVMQVIELPPGELLELSVEAENRLYCCNGIACHNTVNFLTGYGGGAYGLQTTLAEEGVYLPIEECERIVDALFDTYPGLRQHIGYYKRFILDHGCAVSITGRVRPLEEVYSEDKGQSSKALRSGFNHLIQSTASDVMLVCMAAIETIMRDRNLESILVSTVHDSILVDAIRDELPVVHEICDSVVNNIPEVMRAMMGDGYDASWLDVVPLAGDSEAGLNYLDQRKIVCDATGRVDWDALLTVTAT